MLVKCRCGKIWSKQPYKLANIVMGICDDCRNRSARAKQVVHHVVEQTTLIRVGSLMLRKKT